MSTITEDYVSFETAKLLKEKGFDCSCEYQYINCSSGYPFLTDIRDDADCYYKNSEIGEDEYLAPTLQMAMKWLRKIHHIHTEICLYKTNKDDIEPKKSRKAPYYTFGVWDTITGDNIDKRLTNDFIGDTPEQACEAGIKYCIEHLI